MSTTRLTFDGEVDYTVVGHGPARTDDTPAVVLLNRSSRLLRRDHIAALVADGFLEIVSVELQENAFSVEALSTEFPHVRFALVSRRIDIGTQIALALRARIRSL